MVLGGGFVAKKRKMGSRKHTTLWKTGTGLRLIYDLSSETLLRDIGRVEALKSKVSSVRQ